MRQLLIVEWVDSHASNNWRSIEEVADSCELLHCRSVGWLIRETPTMVILVSSISGEKNENIREFATGDIAIPKCAIKSRKVIR